MVVVVMCHFFRLRFAVFADLLKLAAVGAPLLPGFLIFSPEPALIRFLLACMLAYNPRLAITFSYLRDYSHISFFCKPLAFPST